MTPLFARLRTFLPPRLAAAALALIYTALLFLILTFFGLEDLAIHYIDGGG